MDTLLKACVVLLLFLIALIAVAPFTHVATEKPAARLPTIMSTACPLGTVQALIEAKQLQAIRTGRSPGCLEIGVADSLWRNMDPRDQHGLVLAVQCAVSPHEDPIPCLKLYSQSSGALFGSAEMGKVTLQR